MIPTEVDELMWSIAESNDPLAIQEFGERYPNMREELLKRIKTVHALKSAGRTASPQRVPVFRNPKVEKVNLRLAWASVAVAAITVFSFAMWKATRPSPPPAEIQPVQHSVLPKPEANVIPLGANNQEAVPIPKGQNQTTNPTPPPIPQNQPIPETRTNFQLEGKPLHSAIVIIAELGKINVTIAPGLANPIVNVDLQDMTPMEMLKQLGSDYAFDTISDGERAVLIVPKKDEIEDSNTNQTR